MIELHFGWHIFAMVAVSNQYTVFDGKCYKCGAINALVRILCQIHTEGHHIILTECLFLSQS